MKIKFISYCNTNINIYNFINDIWNLNHEYDDILTYDEDFTHLVILNKANFNFTKDKTYAIILEPCWSPYIDMNLSNRVNKVIHYQPEKFNTDNVIFSPLLGTHRLFDCQYHGEIIFKKNNTQDILSNLYNKNKKLSIIINYHYDVHKTKQEHPETRYLERDNLVKKLIDSDLDFDMYGQDWSIHDRRYKGFLSNKLHGLKDYEYTISLENSSIRGNITEKLIDPILCNTVPIYNGHKSVEEFYPNCCEYLEYDGNEINRIKDIINSNKTFKDYDLENAKNKYLNIYNPIKIIKNIIENEDNCIKTCNI